MKRIYAFTLDGEDYPSSKFRSNLRLIAYLMYDYIYKYDGEGFTALVINRKIRNNILYEGKSLNDYYFEYDEANEKYCNIEPFLVGKRSFALTIDDEIMNEDVICQLMEQVLFEVSLLTRSDYTYKVRTISYLSKNIEDERNRKKAVYQLYDELTEGLEKRSLSRKRMITSKNILRRVGLF